ncbi:hypothetical protein GCM10010106_05230 [Thermopolyspora flexuosa]|uniref:Uncharacterized protein n=2 Tax=Thermopolyspora flexuosa TaxID=103836 RepID=A0A543IYZ9_9ACTN|nr:hypothetical protein FHX40_2523 [Thermopolyspora flexuosa]GGM62162.1 hypothetical protein GCM10010106_05230 [Thermopolyspora flexuosa]
MTEAADSSSGKRNERSRSFGKRLFLTLVVLLAIALFGAVTYSPPKSELSFQPIALPVKFIWEDGDVKIAGEQSIITPIGKIAIDANITLGEPNENSFYVTLRDKRRSVDYVYRVDSGTGSFVAIVNGTTQIQVEDRHVTIEVIEGETKTVTFQKVQPSTKRVQTDRVGQWTSYVATRWNEYWDTGWYQPFALARWAYDDSTIGAVPPLGFLWFLVRLCFAILLGLLDLLILGVCLLAAIAFIVAGPVAANIVYGIAGLLLVLILLLVVAVIRSP